MNFEEAYKKLREGTASDEEAAFVARELENVRRISAVLDDPGKADPELARVETETVRKARRAFDRRSARRTVLTVLGCLLAVAALVCALLFIPSNLSAARKLELTRDEAVEAARECLASEVGDERAARYYVEECHRRLRYAGSLFNGVYLYEIELEDPFGNEFDVEVNAHSGYVRVRDADLRHG